MGSGIDGIVIEVFSETQQTEELNHFKHIRNLVRTSNLTHSLPNLVYFLYDAHCKIFCEYPIIHFLLGLPLDIKFLMDMVYANFLSMIHHLLSLFVLKLCLNLTSSLVKYQENCISCTLHTLCFNCKYLWL